MDTKSSFKLRTQPRPPSQRRVVGFSVLLSLLLHGAVFAALVVAPRTSGGHRLAPGTVSVRLVSLPEAGSGGARPAAPAPKPLPQPIKDQPAAIEKLPAVPLPEPEPEPAPEVVQPAAQEPKEVVSLAPPEEKVKPKKSLKEKTKDPDKIIKGAIDRIKKGVDKQPKGQQSSVRAAIERLKEKVAEGQTRSYEPYQPQSDGSPGAGGGGGGGPGAITLVDLYRVEVATQIQKNWAFSKQLAGDTGGLRAEIEFKVLAGGEITDIRFNTKSNNAYFDDSAYKAIVKSNPVTPHPPGISKSYVMVGLRFTPEGVR